MAGIKNLVRFAAKFLNMAKSKTKSKAVVKGKTVKVKAKSTSKKAEKKISKPVKKATKVVKKAKPAARKVKPVVKKKIALKAKVVTKKKVATKKPTKVANKPEKSIKKQSLKKLFKTNLKEKRVIKEAPKNEPKQIYKQEIKPTPKAIGKKRIIEKDINMRYSDDELREFKELIDKKLVSARDELKYLKEALDNHNDNQAGNKAWNMEEGTDTSEMETLMNQISRQHQYIRNLELALVRIENKTYGICRVTGRLIPKERLRIVPHATLSLEAKMNRKSEDVEQPANATAPPADFAEGFED